MPGAKRNSYTSDFKLRVVAAAEDTSNRAAAREFNVGESSIREWRQMKNELLEINPRKRACRGPTAKWPQLENELKRWILSRREVNLPISTVAVQIQARLLAYENDVVDFAASFSWISKFMKRNKLSIRTRTTAGQQLPNNWKQKMMDF